MTHTVATMEVSPLVFEEIKAKLQAAGYDHAILDEDGSQLIDMTGIGLERSGQLSEKLLDIDISLEHVQDQLRIVAESDDTHLHLSVEKYSGLLALAEATLQVMTHLPSKE